MDEEKKGQEVNLLDVDLDTVIEEEGKRSKKKRKTLAIIVTALLAIVIVAFIVFQYVQGTKRAALYQEATAAQENEDYETAIALFEQLGNYEDSPDQMSRAKLMQELTENQVISLVNDTFARSSAACDIEIELPEKRLVANGYADFSSNGETALTVEELRTWEKLTKLANDLYDKTKTQINKSEMEVPLTVSILSAPTNDLLYQVADGEEVYAKIDLAREKDNAMGVIFAQMILHENNKDYEAVCEAWDTGNKGYFALEDYEEAKQCYYAAKEKLVEPILKEVKALAESGDYQGACNYWDTHNENGRYKLIDSAELSDYYNYSLACGIYHGQGTYTLEELSNAHTALGAVSSGFKEAAALKEEVSNIVEPLLGTYHHSSSPLGDGSGYRWWTSEYTITLTKSGATMTTEMRESTSYSGDGTVIFNTRNEYQAVCVIEDGKLLRVDLLDEKTGKKSDTLKLTGNIMMVSSDGEGGLEFYKIA